MIRDIFRPFVWLLRVVPVIGDRRMWNWRRKSHVTDLDYKAEKATPIVSIANNKLVDLVNRRKEIAVWKLKVWWHGNGSDVVGVALS